MMKIIQILKLQTRNRNLVDYNLCSCSEEVSTVIFITQAGNTLECVCVGVCVRVRVCVGVRKLPVFFITVKHTSCVCVGVQKCSALRCVRKQHVPF